ncbi:MAG: transcription-repair coupling factor [Candidatus Aminicenantes bacterium]|nr:transcription-repair coupling factor [Candidatus Aminicenantes bacterium]
MGLDFILNLPAWQELEKTIKSEERKICLSGISESALPFFLANLVARLNRPVIFIEPQKKPLADLAEEVNYYLAWLKFNGRAEIFPPLSEDLYGDIPPSLEIISTRLRLLNLIRRRAPDLLITNLPALLKPVPNATCLADLFLELELDQPIDRDWLIQKLRLFGYVEVDLVASAGEFAWRGGIIDVFSPWNICPYRLELGAEKIVSLREFDLASQRSLKKINYITLPALREWPLDPEFFEAWKQGAQKIWPDLNFRLMENHLFSPEIKVSHFYLALLIKEKFGSLLDLIPGALIILNEPGQIEREWQEWFEETQKEYQSRLREKAQPALSPEEIFSSEKLNLIKRRALIIQNFEAEDDRKSISFSFQAVPRFPNQIPFMLEYLKKLQEEREFCFLCLSQPSLRERMAALLAEKNIPARISDDIYDWPRQGEIVLWSANISHGFSYPSARFYLFGERDILTEEKVLVSRPGRRPTISYFQDLKTGDYVVHNDYGLGLFVGLVRLQIEGINREFMEIHYRDGDKLYVPVEDLKLVQRYTPVGPNLPPLDKLGTQSWAKTKEKTRKAVEKLARDLLELYARRKATPGYSFSPGGLWEEEFEKTFPYEETEDQLKSIEEVKRDMESPSPMDRLLCGDVGFGKTEVAMRAAFRAVMDGKQVAVLCPTTVLASQHLKTFRQRMALFPIRIEALTRLQSKSEQARILTDLKKGLVDIVIGTHRLLSKDVEFHDLGLLIIDEEQRFGVRQKEKIKKMKTSIDVLTMTATPIPRTLNMSLCGLMDISLIETPPKDRLAIHTVVTTFNTRLVASAIRQELARGGQVYYVHNQIGDIEEVAQMICRLVPEAKPVIIHGQMSSRQLEQRMIDFINQKYNVLVSTTIIENGIDIPLVNTLIVDRADLFGLSQLYQLRGRVGRSSRQAYAYFLVPPFYELTPQARERLKALKEFSELGSGFRLAARDLEIRGAGNLLGHQQHGLIEAVGFDYFMQLLDQAVRRIKGEVIEETKCEINLRVDVRIPEDYIPQMNLRLNFYKRISSLESLEEMDKLREEMEDRFGPIPSAVQNLIIYGGIKYLAEKLKLKSLDRIGNRLLLNCSCPTDEQLKKLLLILKKKGGSLSPQGIATIPLKEAENNRLLMETFSLLRELMS